MDRQKDAAAIKYYASMYRQHKEIRFIYVCICVIFQFVLVLPNLATNFSTRLN
jgi:hypothetical protein